MQLLTSSLWHHIDGGNASAQHLSYTFPMISSSIGSSLGATFGGESGAVVGATLGANLGKAVQENAETISNTIKAGLYSDDIKRTMLSVNYLLNYLF